MLSLSKSTLPDDFIRRFRPVAAKPFEKALSRYLFDSYGVRFFRAMTTGDPLSKDMLWSVVEATTVRSLEVVHGEQMGAVGYVIAQVAPSLESPTAWTLPRMLTYRERTRRTLARELLEALLDAPVQIPDEALRLIETWLNRESP
jgi:hypothetical protein